MLAGLPSRIEGPRWPTVLGICSQYLSLNIRIILTNIMVIAIIVPIGVPGMILSLWDMSAFGLGNKAHRCFGRENGF